MEEAAKSVFTLSHRKCFRVTEQQQPYYPLCDPGISRGKHQLWTTTKYISVKGIVWHFQKILLFTFLPTDENTDTTLMLVRYICQLPVSLA